MAQATLSARIQAAGLDETFGVTLSQENTDALIAFLLRGDSDELKEEIPNQAERTIVLYARWLKIVHNDVIRRQRERGQTVADAWT